MNKNIKDIFNKTEKENRAALIGYVVGCDPTFEDSKIIIKEMLRYCDLIEVGIPFNTSTSDSATIMDANDRALSAGANTKKVLKLIKEIKAETNKPIGTMSYLNQIHSLGINNFIQEIKDSKVDFSIVVDSNLNSNEDKELFEKLSQIDVGYIKLIAPTNNEDYIKQALKRASSWIYVVSYAGITGSKKYNLDFIKNSVKLIRKNSELKIGCGFGIRTPQDVIEVSKVSDAVIIGSAIVNLVEIGFKNKISGLEIAKQIGNYLEPITKALKK